MEKLLDLVQSVVLISAAGYRQISEGVWSGLHVAEVEKTVFLEVGVESNVPQSRLL